MAVVLLSGGLDSALNLALAARAGEAGLALTANYGQRAWPAERRAARALAEHYRVEWQEIALPWLGEANPTSLTRSEQRLPAPELDQLDSLAHVLPSMRAVWVANRNGVLVNAAAAFAEARGDSTVLVGFNAEEAVTFPDNSPAYLAAVNQALQFSTLTGVKVASHTLDWDKKRILAEALRLELPLDKVWSCYQPGPERCWQCESCKRTERALRAAGAEGEAWLRKLGRTYE